MKIVKVLNNNAAVTCNEAGSEIVVMGRGIAFQAKPGDQIDEQRIEKTFSMLDPNIADKFQKLLTNIPMAHMLLSERIINEARVRLGKKLHDNIFITLPDHISSAIQRYEQGIILRNPLIWDIKRFYKDEFAAGMKASQIVLEETGVAFLEDEAAFIAMHFVNAQLGEHMNKVYDITYIMQEVCAIVKTYFDIEYDEDSLDYYRFITHLEFFAQRLLSGTRYHDDNDEVLQVIKFKYQAAYACTEKIDAFIREKYHYELGGEEMLYLTVHIARLIRNKMTEEDD